ncbi:MAG: hypothetical protein AAGA12_06545 [Pseudomonadota bacterium]
MTAMTMTRTRIQAGIYEAVVSFKSGQSRMPRIGAFLFGKEQPGVSISDAPEGKEAWHLRFTIPSEALTDGIQTFVFVDIDTGEKLDSFSVVTGEPLNDDFKAEVDLLRAELDMLKKAFRRHCLDTM